MHKEAKLIDRDEKIPLAMFAFQIQTFQLLQNFVRSETDRTSLPNPLDLSQRSIFFDKMDVPQLDQA